MKTITMYDLLGLVKDGNIPKRIIYDQFVYVWNSKIENYQREDDEITILNWDYITINCLNEPVEILEEEKKEIKPLTKKDIEALGYACGQIQKCFTNGWDKSLKNKPLEEEKKIPEKLEYEASDENGEFSINGFTFDFEQKIQIITTVNEIIDYLKSKGE